MRKCFVGLFFVCCWFLFSVLLSGEEAVTGDIYVDANMEFQRRLFPGSSDSVVARGDTPYAVPIDAIDRSNMRRRLLFWLNLRKSRLARVVINSREGARNAAVNLPGEGEIRKPAVSGVSIAEPPHGLSSSLEISYRGGEPLLSGGFEGFNAFPPRSGELEYDFHLLPGISYRFKNGEGSHFRLLIKRIKGEGLHLDSANLSFEQSFKFGNNFYINPGFAIFAPIASPARGEGSQDVRLSPGILFSRFFPGWGNLFYRLHYFWAAGDGMSSLVNVSGFRRSFGRFMSGAGLEGFIDLKGKAGISPFLMASYSFFSQHNSVLEISIRASANSSRADRVGYQLNLSGRL